MTARADGPPLPEVDPTAQDVQRAAHLIRLGRYDEAEPLLRRILAAEPEHFGALTHLAWLLNAADRVDEAWHVTQLLLRSYPAEAEGHIRKARIFHERSGAANQEIAEQSARSALRIDPDDPGSLQLLAEILRSQPGRGEEALDLIGEALAIAPHDASCFHDKAVILVHLSRWQDARATMAEAVALEPASSDYLIQLARIDLHLGDMEPARRNLTTALRLKAFTPSRCSATRPAHC